MRRPVAFRWPCAIDATRLHQTRSGVVLISLLSAFRARSRLDMSHTGFAVGNCCARLEAFRDGEEKKKKLYIMTIGVLHAYRRRGIGRRLLTQLLESAASRKDVRVIYLHVQTGNDVARDFYVQFGFREIGIIRGYYKRIQPDSCYVLAKALSDGDDPAVLLAQEVPGLEAS